LVGHGRVIFSADKHSAACNSCGHASGFRAAILHQLRMRAELVVDGSRSRTCVHSRPDATQRFLVVIGIVAPSVVDIDGPPRSVETYSRIHRNCDSQKLHGHLAMSAMQPRSPPQIDAVATVGALAISIDGRVRAGESNWREERWMTCTPSPADDEARARRYTLRADTLLRRLLPMRNSSKPHSLYSANLRQRLSLLANGYVFAVTGRAASVTGARCLCSSSSLSRTRSADNGFTT
jgi:hypothetical protein